MKRRLIPRVRTAAVGVMVACALAPAVPVRADHESTPGVAVKESARVAKITVPVGCGGRTFEYVTLDGTAKAGQDYKTTVGSLVVGYQGKTSFVVPILEDRIAERDETIKVRMVVTDPAEIFVVGFCESLHPPVSTIERTIVIRDNDKRAR